eukprot:2010281-Rhodomonas_salina.2
MKWGVTRFPAKQKSAKERASASNNHHLFIAVLCFGSAKNPAITEFAAAYEVGQLDNPEAVVTFCKSFQVLKAVPRKARCVKSGSDGGCAAQADMAIIGPEAPLAAGVVDALEAAGVTAIGPTKEMAQVAVALTTYHLTDLLGDVRY